MKGCRALSTEEVILIESLITNARDKCLFVLGLSVGFRVSELLSIRVKNVYGNGKVFARVNLMKSCTKGKLEGRSAILNPRAQHVILETIKENSLAEDDFLFNSRKGGSLRRGHAWRILKEAFRKAGLENINLGSHVLRKTYARNLYSASNKNILLVQKGLGHRNLGSTASYLSTLDDELEAIALSMDVFKAS